MEFKKMRKQHPVQPLAHKPELPEPDSHTSLKRQRAPLSRTTKRVLWVIAGVVVLTIIGAIIYSIVADRFASSPSFQTVLPADKSINELGGWTRVSPPGEPAAFAYSDTINDVTIRVSEQQLPSSSQSVTDIAKGYNATSKITVDKTTGYIGTSFKGPQSVIFSKNGVLILIGSTATISNDAWANYLNSLE